MTSMAQRPPKRTRTEDAGEESGCMLLGEEASPAGSSILSLPTLAMTKILSFDRPENECQVWEWIGTIGQTCKAIRRSARDLAPTDFTLEDFRVYTRLQGGSTLDAREFILKSLCRFSWMCAKIEEIHVNFTSVQSTAYDAGPWTEDKYLISLLRCLITSPNSLPGLKWLDICVQAGLSTGCDLIDCESLSKLPLAVPSLERLCLSSCFRSGHGMEREISPYQLEQFFGSLPRLTSLSFNNLGWMTDEHVSAFMPIVGNTLTCLELINCHRGGYSESSFTHTRLGDSSLESIASNTQNLVSFAIAESDVTSTGLQRVFRANPDIATLNLSYNEKLEETTINVISSSLPRLRSFRCYWSGDRHGSFCGTRRDYWINDDALIALVQAQERRSETRNIPLELVGILKRDNLTARGLGYAMKKGIGIEIDRNHNSSLYRELMTLTITGSSLYDAKYLHYVDGSRKSNTVVSSSLGDVGYPDL